MAEIARYNPEQLKDYRKSKKQMRDYLNTIETSKEEGRKEGREEGRKEGREEVAKKAIVLELNNQQIKEITGLSISKIESLRK